MTLSNFSSLIRKNAHHAQEHQHRVQAYLHEFHRDNFVNLSNFHKEMIELEKNLENIKVYVEHEQHQQLHEVHIYLQRFFHEQSLDHMSPKLRKNMIGILDDAFSKIIGDFKKEVSNEVRLRHHQTPRKSFFKKLNSVYVLDAVISRDASKEEKIKSVAHKEFSELFSTAHAIAVGSTVDDARLIHELKSFTSAIIKEFDLLLDEQLDAEIQENDLLKELRGLANSYPIHRDIFLSLLHRFETKIKKDVTNAKTLYRISRDVRNSFRNAV